MKKSLALLTKTKTRAFGMENSVFKILYFNFVATEDGSGFFLNVQNKRNISCENQENEVKNCGSEIYPVGGFNSSCWLLDMCPNYVVRHHPQLHLQERVGQACNFPLQGLLQLSQPC